MESFRASHCSPTDMPNEEVYHLDSPSHHLYILVKGILTHKQPKKRSRKLKAPCTFGVESFILQYRHICTVLNGGKKAELFSLDFHSFADICEDYDEAMVEDLQEGAAEIWEEIGGTEAAQSSMGMRRLSTHANVRVLSHTGSGKSRANVIGGVGIS